MDAVERFEAGLHFLMSKNCSNEEYEATWQAYQESKTMIFEQALKTGAALKEHVLRLKYHPNSILVFDPDRSCLNQVNKIH